jgi:CBS domain containing-hemolysin-like protein
MNWVMAAYTAGLALCLFLSAAFSAADMAYSSVSKTQLEREALIGNQAAKKALHYASDYDRTIATILFGNDFVNILASSLATLLAAYYLTPLFRQEIAPLLASAIFLVLLLIFGEITPKAVAKDHAHAVAKQLAGFVGVCEVIFFPFVYPDRKLAELIASPLIEKAGKESRVATDEELEAMVVDIAQEGVIDQEQKELLQKSIEFKETSCYEIMTPRVKVFAYDLETPFSDFLKNPGVFSYSRIIVFRGGLDHILGYLPVKMLLRVLVKGQNPEISSLILPVISVPRTMTISSAMALMKETHHHIAVVRDEYGGTEGIITLEDILEELVGEMWDEKDKPEQMILPLETKNSYLVKGKMNIDDFYVFFGLDPDKLGDDYSTVSGWIVDGLGRFAKEGDSFTRGRLSVAVTKCDEYTILEAIVNYHQPRQAKPNQERPNGKTKKKMD